MLSNVKKQEDLKGEEITANVKKAVATVAQNGGYSLVVTNALYGATDISDEVLKVLNQQK